MGSGKQGCVVVYNLICHYGIGKVLIYEPDRDKCLTARNSLRVVLGPNYSRVVWTSTIDTATIPPIDWSEFDVLINCATWRCHLNLHDFCKKNELMFYDFCNCPEWSVSSVMMDIECHRSSVGRVAVL